MALKDINVLFQKRKRMFMIKPGKNNGGAYLKGISLRYNMEFKDPTIDLRLLLLTYGISESNYIIPRYFMGKSFSETFSNDIIRNLIRGRQAGDIVQRMTNIGINLENPSLFLRDKIVKLFKKQLI
ncbi:MAG: hypothetical protein HC905_21375 [Bacteroidales bacterium]|nr:hypothetical protein [Bacteroidales bacterium]